MHWKISAFNPLATAHMLQYSFAQALYCMLKAALPALKYQSVLEHNMLALRIEDLLPFCFWIQLSNSILPLSR